MLQAALLLVALLALWLLWEPLSQIFSAPEALQAWVASHGALGPAMVVLLGVLQVWVAPLPGYPVVFVSGILFGWFWGAIWANLGIMAAGISTALLARRIGRPLVDRFVNEAHLQRLEPLLANRSGWFWFWLLFLPTGDLPYFAAGLSQVRLRDFALALAAARLPFTFVLTWAAQHALEIPRQQLFLLALPLAFAIILLIRFRDPLQRWTEQTLQRIS